jgi:hypothetical protein
MLIISSSIIANSSQNIPVTYDRKKYHQSHKKKFSQKYKSRIYHTIHIGAMELKTIVMGNNQEHHPERKIY